MRKNKQESPVKKLWFTDNKIYILTKDGKELWQSLLWYPSLMAAGPAQRKTYRLSVDGIHWDGLDEDISLESFYGDEKERNPNSPIAQVFKKFPALNASALARKMDIHPTLLAAYICGAKTPSPARRSEIERALHGMGEGLMAVKV